VFDRLPATSEPFMNWHWEQIEPYFQELSARPIDADSVATWLADWTRLSDLINERYTHLNVAVTQDTEDEAAEARFNDFLDQIFPGVKAAEQELKEKLLASGLEPQGFEIPLKKMRTEAEIFRKENIPLLTEERKLSSEYNRVIGTQTVDWQGEQRTLQQMRVVFQTPDRDLRQRAWRAMSERWLEDRQAINQLWQKFMRVRGELHKYAGLESYRAYRWSQMLRLDYTPQDSQQFDHAILEMVVPAATRVYERHRQKLGVERLRPWDLDLDLYPLDLPALASYGNVENLKSTAETIFYRIDPALGDYFHIMRSENLLDLENRKGKAPGGYCTAFPVAKRPFIFMNAVGLPGDVRTILHESGHAFHNFERFDLPYAQQRFPGLEFSEVASMSMELLSAPYLSVEQGGFYATEEATRARIHHLEHILIFWPYMAVVDAFQHWVYENHDLASDPSNCDAKWLELWEQYIPGVDWSDLSAQAMTGWHRKQHIHRAPLYYVEYGLAQLGAVQVWRNAMQDQQRSVERYRQALSLGGTASLPELFQAAGARLAFDAQTLGQAVELVEGKIEELETSIHPS
jgi:oligoendopeptidase F